MTKILDGKKIADKILFSLRKKVEKEKARLKLVVFLFGKDKVNEIFAKQKEIACEKAGINFEKIFVPKSVKIKQLEKEIKKVSEDKRTSGIVLQFPFPKNFPSQKVIDLIPPKKDPDILTSENLGKFFSGELKCLPPVVKGVLYLLKESKVNIRGKKVALVGTGRLVGLPLAVFLAQKGATVLGLNKHTPDISFFTRNSDIIITGAGKRNLIKGEDIKKGAIVIDGGYSFFKGKLVGDVDTKSVLGKAKYIAQVPGGLGPLTCACLLENLFVQNCS